MRLLAPAKINLHLRVGPAAADGFHPLLSWMCKVALFDTLILEKSPEPGVVLTTDQKDLPRDQSNLVVWAGEALATVLRRDAEGSAGSIGVKAHLQKRIPIGGGLGGGSSDAARMLLGLNRLWNLNWPVERLAELSARLGSDLPFFFHGASSICTGRGEIVRPIATPATTWAVLIFPPIAMPTAAVYRRFDEMKLGRAIETREETAWRQWVGLSADSLLPHLVNDLEPAAFSLRPELGRLRNEMEQSMGRIIRMSGSGSTLFTLFDDEPPAVAAAGQVDRGRGLSAIAVQLAPKIGDDLD